MLTPSRHLRFPMVCIFSGPNFVNLTDIMRLVTVHYPFFQLAARMAQWLERRAQRSDDPCVGGSNPNVGRGCRSFG
jgi:hypothetical protein